MRQDTVAWTSLSTLRVQWENLGVVWVGKSSSLCMAYRSWNYSTRKVSKCILTRTFTGECTKRCTRSEQLTCDPVMSSVWSWWQFFPIAASVWELRTASFRISSVSIGQLEVSAERNGWIANLPFKTNMLDPKTNLKFDTIQIMFLYIMLFTTCIHSDYIFYWKHWAGEIMHVTFHLHVCIQKAWT
jgi:hypothetical protein